MDDDLSTLVRARLGPGEVLPAGAGGDHVAWRITAASGEWVVRAPRRPDPDEAAAARREVALLDLVRRTVGRWAPEAVVLDAAAGVTACRWVPGTPLQDLVAAGAVGSHDAARLGGEIGRFVADVAAADPAGVAGVDDLGGLAVDDEPLAAWRDGTAELLPTVAPALAPASVARVEAFLAGDPPPGPGDEGRVVAHADLGAEHVIVGDDLVVAGVIDWSDGGVADPASDLGRVLRDLGEPAFAAALVAYVDGRPEGRRAALAERARYYARCLVVEDVAHALAHRADLVDHGRRTLDRLFAA